MKSCRITLFLLKFLSFERQIESFHQDPYVDTLKFEIFPKLAELKIGSKNVTYPQTTQKDTNKEHENRGKEKMEKMGGKSVKGGKKCLIAWENMLVVSGNINNFFCKGGGEKIISM